MMSALIHQPKIVHCSDIALGGVTPNVSVLACARHFQISFYPVMVISENIKMGLFNVLIYVGNSGPKIVYRNARTSIDFVIASDVNTN
jgi:hypothetical protein